MKSKLWIFNINQDCNIFTYKWNEIIKWNFENEAVEINFKCTVYKLLNAFYASFYRHVRKFGLKQMNHEKW